MSDAAAHNEDELSSIKVPGYASVPFSLPAFLQGLAGVILLFLLFALWAFLRTDEAYEHHQDKLASKTVIVEKPVELNPIEVTTIEENAESLPAAPMEGLYEDGEFGMLPVVSASDGLKPFDAYKKPFEPVQGRPMIALVVTGLGLSDKATQNIFHALPSVVSLSFSPYARKAESLGQLARASGHEIWLDFPLERESFGETDPGPRAILRNASLEQNSAHTLWLLSQLQGYCGVILPENHVFRSDVTDINGVIDELIARGLGIVEMNELGSPEISARAYQEGSPYEISDFVLDYELSSRDISDNFKALELRALKNGKAIGFISPHPLSLQVAKRWIDTLEGKGVQLAPLSAVVK